MSSSNVVVGFLFLLLLVAGLTLSGLWGSTKGTGLSLGRTVSGKVGENGLLIISFEIFHGIIYVDM